MVDKIRQHILSGGTNRYLIPVAVVLAMLVVGRSGYNYWQQQLSQLDQSIAVHQMQLDKYRRIMENSARYEAANRALKTLQMQVRTQRFIAGETTTLAQAKFQNLIKQLALQHKIDIRSTKVLPVQEKDGLVLLRLRVDGKAEIANIERFLLALHGNSHYLFTPRLEIRVISRREQQFYYLTVEIMAIKDIKEG